MRKSATSGAKVTGRESGWWASEKGTSVRLEFGGDDDVKGLLAHDGPSTRWGSGRHLDALLTWCCRSDSFEIHGFFEIAPRERELVSLHFDSVHHPFVTEGDVDRIPLESPANNILTKRRRRVRPDHDLLGSVRSLDPPGPGQVWKLSLCDEDPGKSEGQDNKWKKIFHSHDAILSLRLGARQRRPGLFGSATSGSASQPTPA